MRLELYILIILFLTGCATKQTRDELKMIKTILKEEEELLHYLYKNNQHLLEAAEELAR